MKFEYVIITRANNWCDTGFICEARAAASTVDALNDKEDGENAPGDWQVTSVKLSAAQAEETLTEWIEERL